MRLLSLATILTVFSFAAQAQNFDPQPSPIQDKLENALKRYGTIQRVELSDKQTKTFEGKSGQEYFAWVLYKKSSTAVRRMMIIQLGEQGEKVKIHYPKFNQAITDVENQAFVISFVAPEDVAGLLYRIDASPEATVYLYAVTRGFKRDMNSKN
jgi:hypothetical protein